MKSGKTTAVVLKKGRTEIRLDLAELRKVLLYLRALQHEARRTIIGLLEREEKLNVTDLFIRLRSEQSVVSQHLTYLRKARSVSTHRQGKYIYYSLNPEGLAKIARFVDELCPPAAPSAASTTEPLTDHLLPPLDRLDTVFGIYRALAHPLRLRILEFLDKNKKPHVNKIYNALKIEQSITSQHLRVLRESGLVEFEREGKLVHYGIAYPRAKEVVQKAAAFLKS